MVFTVFNAKQVITDSFKHCTLTVAADGSEDLLIRCLKPNQPCAVGQDRLKGLCYVVHQVRQNPPETSGGLTHTYIRNKNDHI